MNLIIPDDNALYCWIIILKKYLLKAVDVIETFPAFIYFADATPERSMWSGENIN